MWSQVHSIYSYWLHLDRIRVTSVIKERAATVLHAFFLYMLHPSMLNLQAQPEVKLYFFKECLSKIQNSVSSVLQHSPAKMKKTKQKQNKIKHECCLLDSCFLKARQPFSFYKCYFHTLKRQDLPILFLFQLKGFQVIKGRNNIFSFSFFFY